MEQAKSLTSGTRAEVFAGSRTSQRA